MDTWTKSETFIFSFVLLSAAGAVDLCAKGLDAAVFNSSYRQSVVPNGGTLSPELVDSLAPTPLECATSCCARPSCSAVFFFNRTCYLIKCRFEVQGDCTSSPSIRFVGSYWLLVRDPIEIPIVPESVVTATPETLAQNAATSYTAIPSSSPVLPASVSSCNDSECGINEQCTMMAVDTSVKSYCTCLSGFRRDKSTKVCVQDVLVPTLMAISTTPQSKIPSSPHSSLSTTVTSTPAVVPVESLTVSAGEERAIQLPQNEVTINAYVLPTSDDSNKDAYRYQWSLFAHPAGTETGEMDDLNTASLKLSKLRVGTYTFKVAVSADGKYGESYVNITVLPPERDNRGPIAIAKPNYQEITQPNDLIIDGSGSTDDDNIIRYHWEQVSGPLGSLSSTDVSDFDKPTLVLKGLVPGSYRFKLTVTDSDNVQNDTYADALVIKETDYPPKANAGSNIIINLPQNSITLSGNTSQDDKGIVSYEWTRKSGDALTADMLGVRTPFLQLANLQVGDYTFTLTVTDTANQKSSADVHVFVKPEHNQPPVSRAGLDRITWLPISSLILNGSNSTDDKRIVSYLWSLQSGPNVPVIEKSDQSVAMVTKLTVGDYRFQLLVRDEEDLESTSQVVVTIKENPNRPPVAKAGGDRVVYLPAPLVIVNGSGSSDDKGIVSYLWVRDKTSPAAGDVVPYSDHQAVLQLVNVVPGHYKFSLKVTDVEGLEAYDAMTLAVEQDPYSLYLVEFYLSVSVLSFSEINQFTLKEQLSLLLRKSSSSGEVNVVIRSISEEISTGRTLVIFYVDSVEKGRHDLWPATEVVNSLKKLRSSLDILDFQIAKFEPLVCQNNCSGHGFCDQTTKLCICDGFWMEDIFKSYFGAQESNCDWSILYVVIIVSSGVFILGASLWALICYCKRCRLSYLKPKQKHRHRYSGVELKLDDCFKSNEKMELIPKVRSLQNSGIMLCDSDLSSEDMLFVNSKRQTNGFAKKLNNGSTVSVSKSRTAA